MTSDPVLHLLAGPNGAGKSTFYSRVLSPATHLPFVNADDIAFTSWPGDEMAHAYDASRLAAERRRQHIAARESFVAETVFSHDSKLDLVRSASGAGYIVTLHVVAIPLELAVARVGNRVETGGHAVPEIKIRERYERLWGLLRSAIAEADQARVYDNSSARTPFRVVAQFDRGQVVGKSDWPSWMPGALVS